MESSGAGSRTSSGDLVVRHKPGCRSSATGIVWRPGLPFLSPGIEGSRRRTADGPPLRLTAARPGRSPGDRTLRSGDGADKLGMRAPSTRAPAPGREIDPGNDDSVFLGAGCGRSVLAYGSRRVERVCGMLARLRISATSAPIRLRSELKRESRRSLSKIGSSPSVRSSRYPAP